MHVLWDLLTRRMTGVKLRHPDRYREIFGIARRNKMHLVAGELAEHRRNHRLLDPRDSANGHRSQYAENFASTLEELGPTFIKFGQLLSTRPDLLPHDYIDSLARLQDCVAPLPSHETMAIVESELGSPVETLFTEFDRWPIAAASMAQVHRAVMPDGAEVAVKVLRPGIHRQIAVDLEVLHDLAAVAAGHASLRGVANLKQMVHELDVSLRSEMDYLQELENTEQISRQLSSFQRLATPGVFREHSTDRVLTLAFVNGCRLKDLSFEDLSSLDSESIARELMSAYLQQIVVDGSFHCDPHPGNILITETGQLALLDFGMIGRFDMEEMDTIIQLLLAFAQRRGRRVAEIYLEMLDLPNTPDRRAFMEDVEGLVSRYHDMSGGRMGLGTALLDLARLSTSHHLPIPSIWMLLAKAILNLDGVVSRLSPRLDPVKLIREYMFEVVQERIRNEPSAAAGFSWALDAWKLVKNAPRRADVLLGKLANDQFTIQVQMAPLEETRRELKLAATRLSRGMLLSSIMIAGGYLLGSWMRMRKEQ